MRSTSDSSLELSSLREFAGKVAIASTLHEPMQSLLPAISRIASPLKDLGLEWHFAMTDATRKNGPNPQGFYNILSDHFKVCVDKEVFPYFPREDMIEANHIGALRLALESDKPYVFYGDMDRLCLGFNYYPDETQANLNTALNAVDGKNNIAVLGRSPHAINTHLSSLVLTEQVFHHFYNAHVKTKGFFDVASAAYIVSSDKLRRAIETYNGGEFLGVRCNFPEPKILFKMVKDSGSEIVPIKTHQMLRYEAPEKMRNDGRLKIANHVWTPEGYDQVTLASRSVQRALTQNPAEWNLRFTTLHQYLGVLNQLWIQPRGLKDAEIESTMGEIAEFNGKVSVDEYCKRACELFNRYP